MDEASEQPTIRCSNEKIKAALCNCGISVCRLLCNLLLRATGRARGRAEPPIPWYILTASAGLLGAFAECSSRQGLADCSAPVPFVAERYHRRARRFPCRLAVADLDVAPIGAGAATGDRDVQGAPVGKDQSRRFAALRRLHDVDFGGQMPDAHD